MCATTVAPEPSIATELMLESTLAIAHDRWIAEVHEVLLPVTLPEATFWERWASIRYLAERLPTRLRLEGALCEQLRPFLEDDVVQRLLVQSERLNALYRESQRLSTERGMAREYATRTRELLEALRIWCAEFERATRNILEAVVNDDVMRLLGRMGLTCTCGWASAMRC
jgi:hypothetical protein